MSAHSPNAPSSNHSRRFAFTIRAAADPETVARLIAPFAKRGLVPRRFSARVDSDPDWLTVWVEAELADMQVAQMLGHALRAEMTVDAVLVEETNLLARRQTDLGFGAFAAG